MFSWHIHSNVNIKPRRHYKGDVGIDLYPMLNEPLAISPSTIVKIRTGIHIFQKRPPLILCILSRMLFNAELLYDLNIRSRSGLAAKGIIVANSPATIDAGYVGEIIVPLANIGPRTFILTPDMAIAQLVVNLALVPMKTDSNLGVLKFTATQNRDYNGFGSTTLNS